VRGGALGGAPPDAAGRRLHAPLVSRPMPRFRRRPRRAPADPSTRTTVEQRAVAGPPVVEEEYAPPPPPRRPPLPTLWPWLLLLLLLVVGGLLAAYFLTRDDDNGKGNKPKPAAAVTVPRVVGLKQAAAVQRLNASGLTPQIVARKSTFSRGTVFAQDPTAGTRLARRSPVTISVSAVTVVRVPSVVGSKTTVAVQRLRGAGLASQVTTVAAKAAAGVVVATSPKPGTSVAKGSTVALRVSKGQATVPDVVGQTVTDATAALRAAGLVATTFQVPGPEPKGTVKAQKPQAGKKVARGSKVRINVSTGATGGTSTGTGTVGTTTTATQKVSVPNVVGLQQAVAQRRLNAAGLRSRVQYVASSKPSGQVVLQTPAAGESVARGSRVSLNVSRGPSGTASATVPDVVGQTQQDATAALQAAGFQVQVIPIDTGDPSENGTVVDEQPSGGSRAPNGSVVSIFVARSAG
jgi:beta-lactam-binding protein with PASTA domain